MNYRGREESAVVGVQFKILNARWCMSNIILTCLFLVSQITDLLTGSKAGGWGGKAKVAVAAVSGTVVPGDVVE